MLRRVGGFLGEGGWGCGGGSNADMKILKLNCKYDPPALDIQGKDNFSQKYIFYF